MRWTILEEASVPWIVMGYNMAYILRGEARTSIIAQDTSSICKVNTYSHHAGGGGGSAHG